MFNARIHIGMRMMLSCVAITVVLAERNSASYGQPPSQQQPADTPRFSPFRGTSYGMFGWERFGEIESPLAPTSPLTKAFRFSRDGFFRGYDIESDETAIFRNVPPPEPVEALTRDDVRVRTTPEPSVNRPLNAPAGGSQQQSFSRPTSLLEQESKRLQSEQLRFRESRFHESWFRERLGDAIPPTIPTGNANGAQQRWMRDLGRGDTSADGTGSPRHTASSAIGTPPLATPKTVAPAAPQAFVGHAGVVGGMAESPASSAPMPDPPLVRRGNAGGGSVASGRALEREIETLLVTNPSVTFLSPVQVRVAGGTATLRGVVATEEQKVAAGRAVLTHPAVQQVNNLLTVAPLDPSQRAPLIEPR